MYEPGPSGYVAIGHHESGETIVFGFFITKKQAQRWADKHSMYAPYTIAYVYNPNDDTFEPDNQ